jgi:hypothetical protein
MIVNFGTALAMLGGVVGLGYWLRRSAIWKKMCKPRLSFKERVQLPPDHEDILRMSLGQISREIERLENVHQARATPTEEAQAAYLRVFWLRRARSMAIH